MKLLAIDGNSIINRAFYGIRPLNAPDGTPTNAIYGFFSMTGKIAKDTNPDAIAVAFDVRQPTFRHQAYSEYKAGRHPTPPEFYVQMDLLKKLLVDFNIPVITCPGFEADDILGTLSKMCEDKQIDCIVYTGDKDSFQLVGDYTNVYLPKTTPEGPQVFVYDKARIASEFGGLEPKQMIDLKALQGDKSDNIPGVPGIGPKTAIELVSKFGSIENIYAEFDNLANDTAKINSTFGVSKGVAEKLINGKESAEFSKFLGTIKRDIPVGVTLDYLKVVPADPNIVYNDLTKLGLNRFIKDWNIVPDEPERD